MLGKDFTPPVITLQDVLIRQCSMEHRHHPCCTSKSGGHIHLLRGKQGNNLMSLDSEGKQTRKYVFSWKAAYILILYWGHDFQVFHRIFIAVIFHIHKHTHTYLLFGKMGKSPQFFNNFLQFRPVWDGAPLAQPWPGWAAGPCGLTGKGTPTGMATLSTVTSWCHLMNGQPVATQY